MQQKITGGIAFRWENLEKNVACEGGGGEALQTDLTDQAKALR